MVNVWVLADDRAGNVSQVIGVAQALGYLYEIKNINYNILAGLPNFLLGASLLGLDSSSRLKITPPYPDIVIAAGRKTAPVARFIKKQNNGKTFLVQLMYPGDFGAADFDLIAVPNHDNKAPDLPNIIRITGAAHKITKENLLAAKEKWSSVFSELPCPKIALIVGGATKNKKFNPNLGEELAALANKFAANFNNCSFLISTSRRTPQNTSEKIIENIKYPKFVYKWGDKGDNPYLGFLACADYIIVTGDSVSLCS
jgi:mitochondrial fission protein ELM1